MARAPSAFPFEAIHGGAERVGILRAAKIQHVERHAQVGQIGQAGRRAVEHGVEAGRQEHGEKGQQRDVAVGDGPQAAFAAVLQKGVVLAQADQGLAPASVLDVHGVDGQRHERNQTQDQDQEVNRQTDDQPARAERRAMA